MNKRLMVLLFLLALILASCPFQPGGTDDGPYIPLDKYVKKVEFSGQTATVNFSSLDNNNIYLVKINLSSTVVSAADTGGAADAPAGFDIIRNNEPLYEGDDELPRMGHPAADELSANPLPIVGEPPPRARAPFIPPKVGDKREFLVEQYYANGVFVKKGATLRAAGRHGNVWVMDENYNSTNQRKRITDTQAQTLAAKFDIIYPAATNILGYEYGGGPGGDGGRDGDPKIQILVYDIVNATGTVQAAGYFWSKDYYLRSQISSSNEAEIFYIDASQVNDVPDYIYSTLAHEFQHMINFNEKSVKRGRSSASWYNEMLSMMTEDVIADKLGITLANSLHKIRQRIPTFMNSYEQVGITEWNSGNTSASYAKGFAFGAYLLRNYGGANILKSILANNAVNVDSITAALNEFSPGLDFQKALTRFGEVMIFSGSSMPYGVMTFDTTVTRYINGIQYTAYGFDIWKMPFNGGNGPNIFGLTQVNMRPHSLTVHSTAAWKNRSGDFSITLNKPSGENVVLFLMAR